MDGGDKKFYEQFYGLYVLLWNMLQLKYWYIDKASKKSLENFMACMHCLESCCNYDNNRWIRLIEKFINFMVCMHCLQILIMIGWQSW